MLINFIVDDLFSLVRPNESYGPMTLASLCAKSIPLSAPMFRPESLN